MDNHLNTGPTASQAAAEANREGANAVYELEMILEGIAGGIYAMRQTFKLRGMPLRDAEALAESLIENFCNESIHEWADRLNGYDNPVTTDEAMKLYYRMLGDELTAEEKAAKAEWEARKQRYSQMLAGILQERESAHA